jgi:4-hydroxybenzoate polyprenyltransferase
MSENILYNYQENTSFWKRILGIFRMMHFLQIVSVTMVAAAFTYLCSDSSTSPLLITAVIATVFFEQAFIGIHNDYIDHPLDAKYNKNKAITDGWVKPQFAYWSFIACFILASITATIASFFALSGFWTIVYAHGVGLLGIFYNLYLKHTPLSLLPYILGFPSVPTFVWLTIGGFNIIYLWIIPFIVFIGLPAHLANELPDYQNDKKHNKNNLAVALGEKFSTILYWAGLFLAMILIVVLYFVYNFNTLFFSLIIGLSILIAGIALYLLWKNNWKTDLLIFNIITACIAVQTIGFIVLMGIKVINL